MTGLLQWFINRVMHHSHLLVILLFSCCLVFSHCQLAVFSLSSHCCLVLILVLSWCHLIVISLLSHCHLGVISLSTCGHFMAISLSSHYCHLCWGLVFPVFFIGCWSWCPWGWVDNYVGISTFCKECKILSCHKFVSLASQKVWCQWSNSIVGFTYCWLMAMHANFLLQQGPSTPTGHVHNMQSCYGGCMKQVGGFTVQSPSCIV
jgi:hypothetical protein